MIEIRGTGLRNGSGFPAGGSGDGIKIDDITDRRKYFARGRVKLHLGGLPNPVSVNTEKPSFWTASCGELIIAEIGRWMRSQGLIPWNGDPPKFRLRPISRSEFEVRLARRG